MGEVADIIRKYNYAPQGNEGDAAHLSPEFLEMAEAVMCGDIQPTPQQIRELAHAAYMGGIERIEHRLFFREGVNPYRPVIRKNP